MRHESKVDVGKVTNYPMVRAGNCAYISHIQKEHCTKSREGEAVDGQNNTIRLEGV